MRILLFIDSNIKTIPYEIPLLELRKRGCEIIFLSILKKGAIHNQYELDNIPVFSLNAGTITLRHLHKYVFSFIKFCKEKDIDVVFAHLAIPSLVSLLAKRFIRAKTICFRHHFNFIGLTEEEQFKVDKIEKLIDKVNAHLSSTIILPSTYLKSIIHETEHVPLKKMSVIPYVYDWKSFLERSGTIKSHNGTLKLLMISRLTRLKRPGLALELLAELLKHKDNISLTILGVGELANELLETAKRLGLKDVVKFVGFQHDVVPFINDCDLLIHPSLTEASSSVIKEVGVLGRPVIVCQGVGDFNDYIINGENGWLVKPDCFVQEAKSLILNNSHERFCSMGLQLRKTVINKFSLNQEVISSYESLLA